MLGLAIGWTAIVTYYCLVKSSELPSIPLGFDKLGHIIFHFGITLSWFFYFNSRKSNKGFKNALINAVLFSLIYGILIEISQAMFTTTRSADIKDVMANTTGALLVVILVFLITKTAKPQK